MIKAWPVIFAMALQPVDVAAQSPTQDALETLVRSYLWPRSEAEFRTTEVRLAEDPSLVGVSLMRMHDLEEAMRRGPGGYTPATLGGDGRIPLQEFSVSLDGGTDTPVLVQLPSQYSPDVQWPLMFAMHGGPPGSAEGAWASAHRMIAVWAEVADRMGWIVVAPAMLSTVAQDGRTRDRLPYEIFHAEQAFAIIRAVRGRYNVNPDRIVSTGISLGSNFSLAYAAAQESWLSAIIPVSTEGESRELMLRNLKSVPTYVLEGSLDQNIRGVAGPRALSNILNAFGYDFTYREFSERAHEGFQEHYDDVLRWLETRPRQHYPPDVLRVPHRGIVPVARRVHWIESDTRQAVVRAAVTSRNRIDITARWAREITVSLHDRLVDLDRPVEIWANGVQVFTGNVARSIPVALEQARSLADERRIYAAQIPVRMPTTSAAIDVGRRFWETLTPRQEAGTLSFWEMYAMRALEERWPSVGFEGEEAPIPEDGELGPEQVGIRVTRVEPNSAVGSAGLRVGDLLIAVGHEPFFRGRAGVASLYAWMLRELRGEPRAHTIDILRGDRRISLTVAFRLGPYLNPTGNDDDTSTAGV